MPCEFPSMGGKSTFVTLIRRVIQERRRELVPGLLVSFRISEAGGYEGRFTFNIVRESQKITAEDYHYDPTRLGARLKAAARALWLEGHEGRFRISHKDGSFCIEELAVDNRLPEPAASIKRPNTGPPWREPHPPKTTSADRGPEGKVKGLLVIVPCGQRKIWDDNPNRGPTCARDAYTGSFFTVNKRYAEYFADRWIILSAKFGFVSPDFLIPGPYNVTFKRKSTNPVPVSECVLTLVEIG